MRNGGCHSCRQHCTRMTVELCMRGGRDSAAQTTRMDRHLSSPENALSF